MILLLLRSGDLQICFGEGSVGLRVAYACSLARRISTLIQTVDYITGLRSTRTHSKTDMDTVSTDYSVQIAVL